MTLPIGSIVAGCLTVVVVVLIPCKALSESGGKNFPAAPVDVDSDVVACMVSVVVPIN